MTFILPRAAFVTLSLAALSFAAYQDHAVTYDDTPELPGQAYKVHGERPLPRVVTPGNAAAAPSDAIQLFNGTNLDEWRSGDKPAGWDLEGDFMRINGTGSIQSKREFGDLQVHLEFSCPTPTKGNSQGRGNSGLFFMGRYELQILDSFENNTYPDGQATALYGQWPPLVNACLPAGEWSSLDVIFEAPEFDGEDLKTPARVTVLHNGVLVHHAKEFLGATAHRSVAKYAAHGERGHLQLQDHGNPLRFRNIWVREMTGYDEGEK